MSIEKINPDIEIKEGEMPTATILPLGGLTRLKLDPDAILEANKGVFDDIVLLGIDKDGEIVTISSTADGGEVLWLLEVCKRRLMSL